VKLLKIVIQTKEFHIPGKKHITKSQNIAEQTAKANSIISVKYWQTARIIFLARAGNKT